MFYDIYVKLCAEKGVSPSRAAEDCDINKANVSAWKSNGYTPRGTALNRLAEYFGVTVDYLLTGDEKPPAEQTGATVFTQQFFAAYGKQNEDFTDGQIQDIAKYARWIKNQEDDK